MAETSLAIDLVRVPSSGLVDRDDAGRLEVTDNRVHSSLGDSDLGGDVTYTRVGIGGQADQNMSVIAEECPRAFLVGHAKRIISPLSSDPNVAVVERPDRHQQAEERNGGKQGHVAGVDTGREGSGAEHPLQRVVRIDGVEKIDERCE